MSFLTRRDFLKCSSIAAAGAAAALTDAELFSSLFALGARPGDEVRYIPTFCEMCFWNCGAIAAVVNGTVKKLEGNPFDPRSQGKLCARGNAGVGQLYDPDRLRHPMIRSGERGDGRYRKATWDEALDYIAEKMTAIRDRHGPESVAFLMHGGITSHLMHLRAAFGSPNYAFPSFAQCRGARVVAYELTFGMDVGSPERVDLRNSRAVVLFGTHLGENMHNSQVQEFAEAIGNKALIITVDPRFSTAAAKSTYWLPIKPGTDMALMLAWMRIIIDEERYDREYVRKYTTGFDELKQSVKDYTPEWASAETGIPASLIVKTVRAFSGYAPSVCIHPGRFAAWHGNDTQRERCQAILTALLGTWGRKGGIYLPAKGQLSGLEGKPYPLPRTGALTAGPHPFAKTELMQAVRYSTITGQPYPVKGWIVAGTNLLSSVPAPEKSVEAIRNLDLFVVIDIRPFDTAMMADVILPECTYLERHDALKASYDRSLTVSLRQPAVKPMYETREGWWIVRELGLRLGLKDYFPYETYEDRLREECRVMNIDYAELKKTGTIMIPNTDSQYITDSNQPAFYTPSGKIELYSSQLRDAGYDPVPRYSPIPQPEPGWFRLISGRAPVHSFSRTTNNQRLWELFRENAVWINAGIAEGLGIRNGEYVVLENQDGVRSSRVRARVTQRIRGDCVYMVHGFGSRSRMLTRAFNRGADDARLMSRFETDPISGSTGMRVNFVRIRKADTSA